MKKCNKCRKGNLIFTGNVLLSYPPYHIYKCDNCGEITNIREK